MAIDGNLEAGQQLDLADPKIFVNGVELAGGLQTQDERLKYYRTKEQVDAPATITFTHEDGDDVFLVFTFNNRTRTANSFRGRVTLWTRQWSCLGSTTRITRPSCTRTPPATTRS
jgi:hypothetical protein